MQTTPNTLVVDVRNPAHIAVTGIIPDAINVTLGTPTYKADHQVPPEWRDPNFHDFMRPIITTCETGEMAALAEKLHTHQAHLGPAKEGTPLAYPSFNA